MKKWISSLALQLVLVLSMQITAMAQPNAPDVPENSDWVIGRPDDSTAGFALAPDGYQRFTEPGAFIVGISKASEDWPYIQPGPIDRWASNGPHTFRIWFALSALPEGDSTLVLDLADTHPHNPPKLRVNVNALASEHQTPPGNDRYRNATGGREHLIRIHLPPQSLRVGANEISITVVEGSWLLWDHVSFEGGAGAVVGNMADFPSTTIASAESTLEILRTETGDAARRVKVAVMHLGESTAAELKVGPATVSVALEPGGNQLAIDVPSVEKATSYPIELRIEGEVVSTDAIELDKVREWQVHLIPQTHLDIGYTDFQEDVLARQVDHFREALKIIEATKHYPEGERFIWHPEGMWAVEEFLRVASPEEKQAFIKACREGSIHLDVLYAQAMTGLYSEEELMELMSVAKRFEREYGMTIDSAMQSDVPGYTWGLATALTANGVHYMSLGPNRGHRVGRTYGWGDRPFYWETPDGQDKVLFWLTSQGYSMFHGGLDNPTTIEENQLMRKMPAVLDHLENLEARPDYPYDMTMLRYAIGVDNGPPDPTLSLVVHEWNKTHISPRFIISGNSDFLHAFEDKYGEDLPVIGGDFTPYWEDGAASTSKATSVNRQSSERIAQAQILWSMKNPDLALHERFDAAWHKIIMYDEHTWGAYNSISEPDSDFAIQQDKYKQAYAFDGARLTHELVDDIAPPAADSSTIDVHNTASWSRGGLVVLGEEQSSAGDLVRDDEGNPVLSQRLASGALAFLAEEVPAFGTRRYTIERGSPPSDGEVTVAGNTISNGILKVAIDPETGAISSLKRNGVAEDWVDASKGVGLNDYLYILGRNPEENRSTVTGPVTITVEDPGPLVATLRIESEAPGARKLVRRVRLISGEDHVELINTVDKLQVRDPEGVYFGFPFNLPDPVVRVDTPWASVTVESEQLPGANRNFYCVQRFVDLASDERGLTWVTIDAPLVQFDPIRIAPATGVEAFRTFMDPDAFLWSWTMNNHWETNYKADQEGKITFRYALRPYVGDYDAAASEQFGRGICQPLLAVSVKPGAPIAPPLLALEGDDAIVATQVRPSRDGEAWMIRLFNTSEQAGSVRMKWNRPVGRTTLSNPMEDAIKPAPKVIELVPQQVITLRVER